MTVGQIDKTMNIPLLTDHKDPFDRLKVAEAKLNNMTLISTDDNMQAHQNDYGINVIS